MNETDRLLCDAMPQPIAAAWYDVLRQTDPLRAANHAEDAANAAVRLLVALVLAERSRVSTSTFERVKKPNAGDWVAVLRRLIDKRMQDGSAGPLTRATHDWLQRGGKRRLDSLVERRNRRRKRGTAQEHDDASNGAYVEEVREFLRELQWLSAWQIVRIRRQEVLREGGGFEGQVVRYIGREDRPITGPARWSAPLPSNVPLLVSPDGCGVLLLDRTLQMRTLDGDREQVLLPSGRSGDRLTLAPVQDTTTGVRVSVEFETDDVAEIGREWLPNGEHHPGLRHGDTATARRDALFSGPVGVTRAAPVAKGGRAWPLVVLVVLAIAAGGGMWALRGEGASVVTEPAPRPTPPAPSSDSAGPATAEDAAATAQDDDAPAPPVDGLAALRGLLERCATSPELAEEAGEVAAVVDALLADEPREPEAADALHRALGLPERCGGAVALALGRALRPERLGLHASDDDVRLGRALVLLRAVARAGDAGLRDAAAIDAAGAALQQRDALLARAKLDDPRPADRVGALLEEAVQLACEVVERDPERGVQRLGEGLKAGQLATLTAHESIPRACALALLDGSTAVEDRLRWLRLADDGPRCCAIQPAQDCGDPATRCLAELPLRQRALALCRDAEQPTAARLEACELALDATRRTVAVLAALPAFDPRCVPALAAADVAAVRVKAMRASPAPNPDAIQPQLGTVPPKPRLHDEVGRWVAAADAYAALAQGLARSHPGRETHRRDAEMALMVVARTLFAVSYAQPSAPAGAPRCALGGGAEGSDDPALVGLVWDPRRRLSELEEADDPAVQAEARTLGCRAEALDGEAGAVMRRRNAGLCPP